MKHIAAFFVIMLTIIPFTASSQGGSAVRDGFGIGPRLGYYKSTDGGSGSWYIGGQARWKLASVFAVEAALDYRVRERFSFGTYDGRTFNAYVASIPFTVSALLMIPVSERLSPYGVFGIGWYHTVIDYSDSFASNVEGIWSDRSESVFGYHLGLGVELALSNSVAIDADYRWLFINSRIRSPKDLSFRTTSYDLRDSNGGAVTIGVMLYW